MLTDRDLQDRADAFSLPLSGSQRILYAMQREPLRMEHEVHPGIYRPGECLTFKREALELTDCVVDEELLLGSAVVRPGTRLEPGARPARLFSRQACIDVTTRSVLRWVAPAVDAALKLFGLPAD